MKFFDLIYLNYYKFYKFILNESAPHRWAVSALSVSQTLILVFAIDLISVTQYCKFFSENVIAPLFIFILMVSFNHRFLYRSERAKRIVVVDRQFVNKKISIAVALVFFISTASLLFWGSSALQILKSRCIENSVLIPQN